MPMLNLIPTQAIDLKSGVDQDFADKYLFKKELQINKFTITFQKNIKIKFTSLELQKFVAG